MALHPAKRTHLPRGGPQSWGLQTVAWSAQPSGLAAAHEIGFLLVPTPPRDCVLPLPTRLCAGFSYPSLQSVFSETCSTCLLGGGVFILEYGGRGQEEKGTTEDEMAGWHHRLDGPGFGWTPGVGDGQGGPACCDSWGCKESDTTERLN